MNSGSFLNLNGKVTSAAPRHLEAVREQADLQGPSLIGSYLPQMMDKSVSITPPLNIVANGQASCNDL